MKTNCCIDRATERTPAVSGLVAAALMMATTAAFGADPAPAAKSDSSEKAPDYRNWFDVSVGGTFIEGDKGQFQKRRQLPEGAFGGVEAFHFEQDIGKKGLFRMDGRGIFDNHDYGLKFEISHPEIGYLRAGVREFRTWYDGSGGYHPGGGGKWFPLYDNQERAIDRGEIFFEAGLTLPDKPELTFEYRRLTRDGTKESLVWGDATIPGLPAAVAVRGQVPAFWDIDERRDLLVADVKHTIGKSDLGLGIRYEISDQNNARKIARRPGEAADRRLTHREGVETDMLNAHAFSETQLTENFLFTTGYSFTTLDTDLSGSRIYGADFDALYDPNFARRQNRDEGYYNLEGGSQMIQHVVNLNLMWTPWPHFTLVPSVRVEKNDLDATSLFVESNYLNSTPAAAGDPKAHTDELAGRSERAFIDVSEAVEARYTGFTNWVLYARGFWLQGEGDQVERLEELVTGGPNIIDIDRDSDFDRFTEKYTVGANWYPLARLHFAAQYYHKVRIDDFKHNTDNTPLGGNLYPAFLIANDFETDDVNFRVTWRPRHNLTLVSRYDYQLNTIQMQGSRTSTNTPVLAKVESAEMTSHIFSESITWTPFARLFLQGSATYARDNTDTDADKFNPGIVTDFRNNYWNASAAAGFVLDDKTDLNAQYYYYRSNNYEDNSALSVPYGAEAEEHGVTVSLMRRLKENLRCTVKYGYFQNRDRTSGGFNDYDAHLVYSKLSYLF